MEWGFLTTYRPGMYDEKLEERVLRRLWGQIDPRKAAHPL